MKIAQTMQEQKPLAPRQHIHIRHNINNKYLKSS